MAVVVVISVVVVVVVTVVVTVKEMPLAVVRTVPEALVVAV